MDGLLSPESLRALTQGGLSVVLFIIWIVSHKSHEKNMAAIVGAIEKDRKDDYEVKQQLLGVLTRIEVKLDMAYNQQRYNGEDRRCSIDHCPLEKS